MYNILSIRSNLCLAFDPRGVTKLGLIYTTLSRICLKKHLYLLFPLPSKKFQVDPIVQEEMDHH
jgi:hypothetical protein